MWLLTMDTQRQNSPSVIDVNVLRLFDGEAQGLLQNMLLFLHRFYGPLLCHGGACPCPPSTRERYSIPFEAVASVRNAPGEGPSEGCFTENLVAGEKGLRKARKWDCGQINDLRSPGNLAALHCSSPSPAKDMRPGCRVSLALPGRR